MLHSASFDDSQCNFLSCCKALVTPDHKAFNELSSQLKIIVAWSTDFLWPIWRLKIHVCDLIHVQTVTVHNRAPPLYPCSPGKSFVLLSQALKHFAVGSQLWQSSQVWFWMIELQEYFRVIILFLLIMRVATLGLTSQWNCEVGTLCGSTVGRVHFGTNSPLVSGCLQEWTQCMHLHVHA